MRFFLAPALLLWRSRTLLIRTTINDLRTRFAGSILGMTWVFFYPLFFLAAYSLIIINVYGSRLPSLDRLETVGFIFCGLIPFLGFAEAFLLGTGSVTGNPGLIKNTLFPVELVPVKTVLMSQISLWVSLGILFLYLFFLGRADMAWFLILPVYMFQLLFSIGTVWILSSLNVFIRDLQNIAPIFMMILMMISPIGWCDGMVDPSVLPFLKLNPLYYFIVSYRTFLFYGTLPDFTDILILMVFSIATSTSGLWFFMKMKKVFADNV